MNTYELFRGKANEEEGATEERFVGKFKVRQRGWTSSVGTIDASSTQSSNPLAACSSLQGRFCLYKLNEDNAEDWDEDADGRDFRVSRGIPPNGLVQVLIRVYIVSVRERRVHSF